MPDSEIQSQHRFDCLLAVIDQLVIQLNQENEITGIGLGRFSWLDKEQALGRTFTALFPNEIAAHIATQIEQAKATGEPQKLHLNLKPEHALHWHELGLSETQTWDTIVMAVSENEVLWVARDESEAKRLEQKVFHQAQRDPLTGAYNRRSLMTILQQSVAQAQRYDWVCSFLVIDIDDFRQINDQHGWDVGDKVLQQFVSSLLAFKRTADFFARYSDDRFVMFLPETNQDQALLAAERVRRLASEQRITTPDQDLGFTVSIGAATLQDAADTPESIMKRAEQNLVVAKQSGANRIEGEA